MVEGGNDGVLELKFVLPPERAAAVLAWMRRSLDPDPHGGTEDRDTYRVQSIYLDTPRFDVFHRRGSYGRAKFRVRRYGDSAAVFLERKLKRGGVVRKRRTLVEAEAVCLAVNGGDGNGWMGNWFARRLALRRLEPKVLLNYVRVARQAQMPTGTVRVTLDRQLYAAPIQELGMPESIDGLDLLAGGCVLEVKFRETLPVSVRQTIEDLRLQPSPCSKYRLAVQECGLAVPEATPSDPEGTSGA